MTRALLLVATCLLTLATPPTAGSDDPPTPGYAEEITVLGEAPFLYPVPEGQPVRIRFGIGELEIESAEQSEVRADLEVTCRERLSEALCERYRRKLRLEPRQRDDGVEVRLVGLSKWKLRKLRLRGRVTVPRRSPLDVRIGIGDVEIHSAARDLSVRMGIGDLTVHVPESGVASVEARTRIGDASVQRSGVSLHGKRRLLLGARVDWSEGTGMASVEVGLKIGDAKVVLE